MTAFTYRTIAEDGPARAGVIGTAHGEIATPVFMPVGTAGTVKAMTADAVRATGASIVLGNTYHLMLRPGVERIAALGGLHRFMDWPGPILTNWAVSRSCPWRNCASWMPMASRSNRTSMAARII